MTRIFTLFIAVLFSVSLHAQTWQAVGVGVSSTHGLALWDGKLAVAGSFNNPCDRIAAWDGSNYICMANGVGLVARGAISFNGDLVVIGDFWNTHQPCVGCNGIARWDGSAWLPMGTGFNNDVLSIAIWNGDLVVGGDFTEADGNTVSRIARWTGTTWVPIGGTSDFSYDIRGLEVYNGELWAGGDFIDVAGNSSYDRVVKWNGSNWIGGSQIGVPNGVSSTVRCFYVDPVQNKLYMGGHFLEVNGNTNASGVAVYDGGTNTWAPLGGGVNSYVRALSKYNGNIIVGGDFSTAGSVNANKIARWNPTSLSWTAMHTGMNDYVKALEVYNGSLYAGGPFTSASGSSINGIAKWTESASAGPVAGFTISDASICPGQCITFSDISTGSPSTWSWTFPGGSPSTSSSQNAGTVCFADTGTYNIKLKVCNGNGCDSVYHSVVVSVPNISAGSNVSICNGQGTSLQATGGSSYVWSPSTGLSCTSCASPVATPASTTTYTVTGTAGGCSNTSSVTVTVNPLPTVNAGTDASVCFGSSTTLYAAGGSNHVWSPSGSLSCSNCTSPVATPVSTTTYTVTVTNVAGCSASDAVTITVLPVPIANAGTDETLCLGESVALNATGGSSFAWSPSTGLSCTACASPTASPTSTITYTVNVTGANGCSSTDAVTVSVSPLPVANAGTDVSICDGGNITLSGSGGSGYAWSPAAGLSCTSCASPTASPALSTTYTLTITNGSGCIDTDDIIVSVNALPLANAGADVSGCEGENIQLNASGGTSYTWSSSNNLSCANCPDPIATLVSTVVYNVVVTDANGCTDSDDITITVWSLPIAESGNDTSLCAGESILLNASGGNSYDWSPAAGLSCTNCPDPTASPSSTTNYSVIVTDANGCSASSSVMLTVFALPVISAGADASICEGNSITLNASGGSFYEWMVDASLSCQNCQSPDANPLITTLYTVTGTDANGCSGIANVTILVNPLPVAYAGVDDTICIGEAVQLLAIGGTDYLWSPAAGLSCTSCPDPVATPLTTTTYSVQVTDAIGCSGSDDIIITTLLCTSVEENSIASFSVYPNPSAGDLNISSSELIEEVEIFQMNGEIVYKSGMLNQRSLEIETASFSKGIYMLRIRSEGRYFSKRHQVN